MNRFNKKRNLYITVALITILLIGLGYAFLTSNLNIIGNTNINKNTWGVEFENVQVTEGSVESSTPQISNKTTVNYTVTLDKPGDYYEFTVDASNKGSIDAMIDSVSSTGLTTEQKKYLTYSATYTSGKEISKKQGLKAGATKTIKVRIDYKKDITAEDLPSDNQQLNLTFTIDYVQADDTVEPEEQAVCKRATTLHNDGTHTFGQLGTAGTLTAGDAFDCDVNKDGTYNSETERFYYVSPLDTDSNYAVLIYYNNVSGGEPNNTATYAYDSAGAPRENGPATAVQQLPATTQWKNVRLSNTTRKIKDETGTEYIDFSYEGYSARLLTYQEVVSACGSGDPTTRSYLNSCRYLDDSFTESTYRLWLETIDSNNNNKVKILNRGNLNIDYLSALQPGAAVRPAIEVPKSRISY